MLKAKLGVCFPEPVARILLELVEKQIREFLLTLQVDLGDDTHFQKTAEMQNGEADEGCIEHEQGRDVDVEALSRRGQPEEGSGDDEAGEADGDRRQHGGAHPCRDQAGAAGGDEQASVRVGPDEQHDRNRGEEAAIGIGGQNGATDERAGQFARLGARTPLPALLEDGNGQRQDGRFQQAQIDAIGGIPEEVDDDLNDAEADKYRKRNKSEGDVELLHTDASLKLLSRASLSRWVPTGNDINISRHTHFIEIHIDGRYESAII